MITHKTTTERTFNTLEAFERWFKKHALVMENCGFSKEEIETLRIGKPLQIQDREVFVDCTVTRSVIIFEKEVKNA